ncbi:MULTISPECIES: LysR family transcriptional regulator [Burkholderiaceae]|uniref:Transcriptional regulator, LysR family n=1 Tax=Caballeronia sordidicola TaxID=196367 RepID=A0A242MSF6_CABSO|nr:MULTISPECIES: LysR family transcriptional regulator [Burkholderiaceae]AMH43235.1 LysR family transcriptional regulator [Burkholderia sp. PAMC 26561]OTP74152.1 Transcriptional regulator, LysR family [Caballeronia sordidicola]
MTIDISSSRESVLSARSLRYLHEVESHGGVRAAADALGINPSVISRQVGQLERDYGVVLLERSGRRAVLTEIGMSLVEHFRESKRRDADMLAQLGDFKSLRRGRLGIGVGEGRIENLLATVMERFSLQFPDIVVEFRSGATSEIIAMVRNDDVDLGLCAGGKSDPAIRARIFRAAPFCAMVSPRHALAGERRIRFEQLRDQRLIFMPERFGVQQYLDAIISAERLTVTPSYRCDLFSAAQAIAAAGLGVAFMSTDAARQYLDAGRLVALEIEHPIAREFSSQVIRRVGRRLSPAAEFLWRQLVEAMQRRWAASGRGASAG